MERIFKFILGSFILVSTLHGCKTQNILLHPENKAFIKPAPPVFKVLLETTKGNIVFEVRRAWAPHGVDRFYNLVQYGYYDNAAFFRIRVNTWAQFGIAGNPQVAQAWRYQTIPDD